MKLKDYLTKDQVENLMKGLYNHSYSLVLGAGASASSINYRNNNIPVSSQLVKDILETYKIPHSPNRIPDINRVFQQVSSFKSNKYNNFRDYLNETFSCKEYSDFYPEVLYFKWNYIWNLNIDDCIEKTCRELSDELRWNIRSINFTDEYIPESSNETLHIHLHGSVNKINSDADNIIFTISQYINYMNSGNTWLNRFKDIYPQQPVIVLGATMHGESDLQNTIIDGQKYSNEIPSIIVLRSIDDFDKTHYNKLGLIPIQATTDEFIKELRQEFDNFLSKLSTLKQEYYWNPNILENRIQNNIQRGLFKSRHAPHTHQLDNGPTRGKNMSVKSLQITSSHTGQDRCHTSLQPASQPRNSPHYTQPSPITSPGQNQAEDHQH